MSNIGKKLSLKMKYYKRLFPAYFGKGTSHLTFWREKPESYEELEIDRLGKYYMPFYGKALYAGHFDSKGVPLLDYRGEIGKQYNPIAIAQYGLANYNCYLEKGEDDYLNRATVQANWLVDNLEENAKGIFVWNHHFDWEHREILRAPWYSGLSQGAGISLLARMYTCTRDNRYLEAAKKAYDSFKLPISEGGVIYTDKNGDSWIEEAISESPTHILNGFLWALWGIWDFYLLEGEDEVKALFDNLTGTLERNLHLYDTGYWSLYELAGLKMKMLASSYYHSLHIVQLSITARITGKEIFNRFSRTWAEYADNRMLRLRATVYKAAFKLIYY